MDTIRNSDNGKAANIHNNGAVFLVIFGWLEGSDFRVSHARPSRTYKSRKGAERAANRWAF